MHSLLKPLLLSLVLCSGIIYLCSFRSEITASIIGSWTQTEVKQLIHHRGSSVIDTVLRHPQGYTVAFSVDSQYHFSGPYDHRADGSFTISCDTLSEYEPKSRSTEQFLIIALNEHSLALRSIGSAVASGIAIETTTMYERK